MEIQKSEAELYMEERRGGVFEWLAWHGMEWTLNLRVSGILTGLFADTTETYGYGICIWVCCCAEFRSNAKNHFTYTVQVGILTWGKVWYGAYGTWTWRAKPHRDSSF